MFAAKNASVATVKVLLENEAHIEAKNTTVIEITLYRKEPYSDAINGFGMRSTYRADVTFNILCLARVYDNITTIAIPYVFMNASYSHSTLA